MTKKTTRPQTSALKIVSTDPADTPLPVTMGRYVATRAKAQATYAMEPWLKQSHGDVDLTALLDTLTAQTDAIRAGDTGDVEAMLFNQSLTLQAMFTALSRRAAVNVGEHMGAVETYLRLALKAQSQCRSTLETLAEIKNPRPATFVRQANIANGPQQVNNGAASTANDPLAPARDISGNHPNELLTDERATNGNQVDTRSKAEAGRSNSRVEAMGTLHRAANGKR